MLKSLDITELLLVDFLHLTMLYSYTVVIFCSFLLHVFTFSGVCIINKTVAVYAEHQRYSLNSNGIDLQ